LIHTGEYCSFGKACRFAHGENELRTSTYEFTPIPLIKQISDEDKWRSEMHKKALTSENIFHNPENGTEGSMASNQDTFDSPPGFEPLLKDETKHSSVSYFPFISQFTWKENK